MVLSLSLITHLSVSRLGPLSESHISRSIGELRQIVSMYSNSTLDCRKAAPTTTTFLLGRSNPLNIAYNARENDLPKPRLAISMGNLRSHISCKINPCDGRILMFNRCLVINERYSGLVIR